MQKPENLPVNGLMEPGQFAMQALFSQAVTNNQIDLVEQLLTQEPKLATAVGWHQQTELHKACLVGNLNAVKLLINAGADPNARNNFGETPLHYACKQVSPTVLHWLITHGGNVTLVDQSGKGVIHHSAESGSVPMLAMLEAMFPDIPFTLQDFNLHTPLHLATKGGKMDAFKFLLRKGRSNLRCADKDGNLPIHISAEQGYGHMTWTLLCAMGPSALEQANNNGVTPFQLASSYDTPSHKELMKELHWISRHPGVSDMKQHATQLWYFYLFLPFASYGAAIVITQLLPIFQPIVFFPVIGLNFSVMGNSLHRMQHICRWPHPFLLGSYAAGMFHTIIVYLFVILPDMQDYVKLNIISFLMMGLLVGIFVRILTKDPDILKKSAEAEITGKTLTILDVCDTPKWMTYCTDCELVRPAKTKHCKLCEVCTLDMDHHCLFLLRCIARGNHYLFVWLLIICETCVTLFLYCCYVYVVQAYSATPSWLEGAWRLLQEDTWVMSLFLMNCFSFVWGISLMAYQFFMISNGYTAYFAPQRYHGNILSGFEKMMNVVNFLMNRKPHVVNPSLKVYEQATNTFV